VPRFYLIIILALAGWVALIGIGWLVWLLL
jgi:hypothetical protein